MNCVAASLGRLAKRADGGRQALGAGVVRSHPPFADRLDEQLPRRSIEDDQRSWQ